MVEGRKNGRKSWWDKHFDNAQISLREGSFRIEGRGRLAGRRKSKATSTQIYLKGAKNGKYKTPTRLDPWEIWDKRLPYWFLKIYEIRFHFKNQAKKSFENLKFLRQTPFPFKNQAKQKFWKPYSFALNNHMDPISF